MNATKEGQTTTDKALSDAIDATIARSSERVKAACQTTTPSGADKPLPVLLVPVGDMIAKLNDDAAWDTYMRAYQAITVLIARNAKLTAAHAATERDACLQAERANELQSRLAALAAENKELRRQLAPIDKAVAQWVADGSVYWNLPMIPKDVREALARTPTKDDAS